MPILCPNGPSKNVLELFPDLPASMFEPLFENLQNGFDQQAHGSTNNVETESGFQNQLDQYVDIHCDNKEIDSDIITETLKRNGISEEKLNLPPKEDNLFKNILNKSGASVENASRTIASVMMNGKFENSKLKAAELVLDLHGIRDREGKVNKQPNFQFVIKDGNVNINQIFAPSRSAILQD